MARCVGEAAGLTSSQAGPPASLPVALRRLASLVCAEDRRALCGSLIGRRAGLPLCVALLARRAVRFRRRPDRRPGAEGAPLRCQINQARPVGCVPCLAACRCAVVLALFI